MKKEFLLISIASDSHRNLGCLSLYASLKAAGVPVILLFIPRETEYSEAGFSSFLKENDFDIVGISLTTRDFYFAQTVTSHIRKHLPESHIVWGGIHPTSKPGECLEYADSICIGEGELSLIKLITNIGEGTDISGIPGIGVKNKKEGKIIINPPELIKDLNELPFPHFDFKKFYVLDSMKIHRFSPEDYIKYSKHNGDGYVILTSRSCPNYCSYCINSFLNRLYKNNSHKILRRVTVDNVIKEIKYAMDTIPGIGFINFMDDHFLTNQSWILEFCLKYKKEIKLPFIIRATPNAIKEDLISLLKSAGLTTVQMGIESGSEKTHKDIFHRIFKKEEVLMAADILHKNKLECLYDFIIENDFETDEDRGKTIELMLDLPKPYTANLFSLTVFPETDLEMMYKEKKMEPRIDPYKSNYFDFNQNDFFYQMASLIPLIDEKEARHIFENHKDIKVQVRLKDLFREKTGEINNIRKNFRQTTEKKIDLLSE